MRVIRENSCMLKEAATAEKEILNFYKHRNHRKTEIYQMPKTHSFTQK